MERTRRLGMVAVAALVAVNGVVAFQARALPRYSARYEQHCSLCHVNPTGGGLRTTYASQQLVPQEIAWSKGKPGLLEGIDPKIGKNITIGTDFRELYVYSDQAVDHLNFFQMQSDLYFDFQLSPRVSLYYDRGMSNSYELFGLGYLDPVLYVKAGRFVPAYGWKFDDHTMFVRNDEGFAPPGNSDVGVEIGVTPGKFEAELGMVNGNRGSLLDNNPQTSTIGNAMVRYRVGPLGAATGLSGYHDPGLARTLDSGSLYGYLIWKNLTWLGQADLFRQKPPGSAATTGFVTSHEFSLLLHQGLELKATYDFYDPDRDHATGAKTRWGGGVFVMPEAYVGLEGLVRRTTFDNGIAYSGQDFYETVLQLHLLF